MSTSVLIRTPEINTFLALGIKKKRDRICLNVVLQNILFGAGLGFHCRSMPD